MRFNFFVRGVLPRGAAAAAAALSFFCWTATVHPASAQDVPQLRLAKVTVSGLVRLKEDAVLAETGLRVGDQIDIRDIQRAVRRLFASGNYDDITPYAAERDSATVELTFAVVERPYIADIEFRGLEHLKGSVVLDTVELKAGGPLSRAKIADAEAMTRRLLAQKGFQMKSFRDTLEAIANVPGAHRLIFEVQEGSRVALADVEFEGNTVFSDEELAGSLETKEEGFFWFRTGTYDEEKARTDLRAKLPGFYGSQGYLDFAVTGDSLIVDPENGKARLVITVEEGPQYKLAEFEVRGNRRFPTEELKAYFEEQGGGFMNLGFGSGKRIGSDSIFDATAFLEATDRVKRLYNNQGFLYSVVEP